MALLGMGVGRRRQVVVSAERPSLCRACSLQVKESTVNIDENGVRLELTLVDTPGFGDLVDNSQWCANTVDGVCRVNAWL